MATRVANFDSEVPALNRREVLAHGHQVRFRGNPPFQDHGEMTIKPRFERSVILRFGGARRRWNKPAREMPATGRRTIQSHRSNASGHRSSFFRFPRYLGSTDVNRIVPSTTFLRSSGHTSVASEVGSVGLAIWTWSRNSTGALVIRLRSSSKRKSGPLAAATAGSKCCSPATGMIW